ncbi:MAG: Cna B-type domain-containing protein [Oscillospiraceae bacterium]|jgi:pilin isopeptide linkage protein|nr:Cna B-type domain-containing protein [Oscillospiraceae bacterium]
MLCNYNPFHTQQRGRTGRKISKIAKKTLLLLFVGLFLVSAFQAGTFAWIYNSDHKTNEIHGQTTPTWVVLNKFERDIEGNVTQTPVPGAEFYLYREGDPDEQIGGRFLSDENGHVFPPFLDPGNYYFIETDPSPNYIYDIENDQPVNRYPFNITGLENITEPLIITAYNQRMIGSLVISKTVENENKRNLTPAQLDLEFIFTVMFSDDGTYSYSINGGESIQITSGGSLTLKHGESAVFENIPAGLFYTVIETPTEGCIIKSENHCGTITEEGVTASFVNIYSEPDRDETELTIYKVIDGELPDSDMNFSFTLIVDGEIFDEFTLKGGESKAITIPAGSVYEVIENDYSSHGFVQSITNGYGTASGETIEIIQTNRFLGRAEIKIQGEKTWDKKGYTVALPESITVSLKDGVTLIDTATVIPGDDGKWEYTFTAPKYRYDGVTEIEYTIIESPLETWKSETSGFDIKNTYIPPVAIETPSVVKVITGEFSGATAQFQFVLAAQDGAPMPEGSVSGNKTISITGEGELDFGDIAFIKPGTYVYVISELNTGESGWSYDNSIYTWTVVIAEENGELAVGSQTLTKSVEPADKAVFTNHYTDFSHINVSVTKVWIGDGQHPSSVQVQLYKNGVAQGSAVTLNADNNWAHTWTDLEEGAVYTADEPSVPEGYTKTISGSAENGFTITNSSISKPKNHPGNSPNTSDHNNLFMWLTLMIVSFIGSIITVVLVKRTKYKAK